MVEETTVPCSLQCPSCNILLVVRLEVRGGKNFAEVVKEGRGEGTQVRKNRPNFKMG